MKEWLKKYDVLTKALAVLISVVLWIYVVTVVDPVGELPVSKISPTYMGSEQLLNTQNLIVGNADDISVSMRLTGKRRALATLNPDDVKVEVDISKIVEPGTYTLSYKIVLPTGEVAVASRNPSQLEVKIDRIVTATIPVKVVLEGSVADGYIAGDATTVPSTLSVLGLAEEINSISYAQVKIGKKDLNTSIHQQMSYAYFDADGKELKLNSVQTEARTVEVILPVLKTKTIPLDIDVVEGGGALEKNVNYAITPGEITVAGEEKIVDAMESVVVGVADLSKISGDTALDFKFTLPDGIRNMSGESSASVALSFNGLKTKSINTNTIEIINIPRGYNIEPLTNNLSVLLRGSEGDLDNILPQNVRAVVDLTSMVLTPGQHTLTARITVDGNANVGAVGEYKIDVKVSK